MAADSFCAARSKFLTRESGAVKQLNILLRPLVHLHGRRTDFLNACRLCAAGQRPFGYIG
jgi:hypothetical protein